MNLTVIKKSLHVWKKTLNQANIYLFKVNNRNTRKRYEICSKLTIKTPERRHWRSSCVYIVNFEHISHLYLVFLLLLWTSKCKLGNNYKWHFTGAAVRRCSTKLLMFSNVFWKFHLKIVVLGIMWTFCISFKKTFVLEHSWPSASNVIFYLT